MTETNQYAAFPAAYLEALHKEADRVEQDVLARHNVNARTILLVGGGGYIGTVITRHLLERGYNVRCIDRFIYRHRQAAQSSLGHATYRFYYGDIGDEAVMTEALTGTTDVVLLAGLVGDPITAKYPDAAQEINQAALLKMINSFDGLGLNKVVFISTCSNYGLIEDDDIAAEDFPLNPLSAYAKAKVAVEQALIGLSGKTDFSATILRFATAFGLSPRMRFDLTISEFVREMYLGRDLLVYDADTWRPYCHVNDFAEVVRRLLEAPVADVAFEVFNAGGNRNNYTKRSVVEAIHDALPDAPVRYKEFGGDPRNYRVNFAKIKSRLHFEPAFSIPDGVAELIGALSQHMFDDVDERPDFYGNYRIDYPESKPAAEGL